MDDLNADVSGIFDSPDSFLCVCVCVCALSFKLFQSNIICMLLLLLWVHKLASGKKKKYYNFKSQYSSKN